MKILKNILYGNLIGLLLTVITGILYYGLISIFIKTSILPKDFTYFNLPITYLYLIYTFLIIFLFIKKDYKNEKINGHKNSDKKILEILENNDKNYLIFEIRNDILSMYSNNEEKETVKRYFISFLLNESYKTKIEEIIKKENSNFEYKKNLIKLFKNYLYSIRYKLKIGNYITNKKDLYGNVFYEIRYIGKENYIVSNENDNSVSYFKHKEVIGNTKSKFYNELYLNVKKL